MLTPRLAVPLVVVALALTACSSVEPDTDADGGAVQEEPGVVDRTESQTRDSGDLLARLRAGGLTIVVRHAATDRSDPDDADVDLEDCATQRNLSAAGRHDAELIGAAIRELRIPVEEVWSSPYCRSRDTAELAFGRTDVVHGLERLYPEPDEHAERRLNELIREEAPDAGDATNLVISGHGVYPSVLSPGVTLAEGEAAVYERDGDGFALLDRVLPAEWAEFEAGSGTTDAEVDGVLNSVVSVRGPRGDGSAFGVAIPGILVTAAHVVADAAEVDVMLRNGTVRTAQVLGRRVRDDIAALRVDGPALPPLHSRAGLAEAQVGDRAYVVGANGAVAVASIDALGDSVTAAGGSEFVVVRTDAGVPPSSAGGPLVNDRGEVLGVLTVTDGGTGSAVPVDVAQDATFDIVRAGSAG